MGIILTGIFAFAFILLLISFVVHKRRRKKLRDLEQQIWAWESGPLDVSLSPANNWLDYMILNQGLGYRLFGSSKDVVIEKHRAYKSYFFNYKSFFPFFGSPVRGVLIQFKEYTFPSFTMMLQSRQRWFFTFDVGLPLLELDHLNRAVPADLSLYAEAKDEYEVRNFLFEHPFLKHLFENPNWLRLYAKHQFIAIYFSHDIQDEEESAKELFGLDEKIARAILGGENVDPTGAINRLKSRQQL